MSLNNTDLSLDTHNNYVIARKCQMQNKTNKQKRYEPKDKNETQQMTPYIFSV